MQPKVERQVPKWHEIRELVQFRRFELDPVTRRLNRAWTIDDLRRIAKRVTPRSVFDYVDGNAEEELTATRNREAFQSAVFHPDLLHDVSDPDLSTELFGTRIDFPLAFAPTGYTRMMHHHGEESVARVAQRNGVPYALSTVGTTSIEDVAKAAPSGNNWFQLYLTRDQGLNAELIGRAREAGFNAIILTVDTNVAGARLRDNRNGLTIPPSLTLKTFADMSIHPAWWFNKLTTRPITFASLNRSNMSSEDIANTIFDPSLDLRRLDWLRGAWQGPLLVKGALSEDLATAVAERGADGFVLSNHGGRQLDRTASPLDTLPQVRQNYPDKTILVDSGVRHGQDIVTAKALGADAVMIGRAYLYGIMAGGEAGVQRAYDLLRSQYQRGMQLLGVRSSDELGPQHVTYQPRG